MSKNIRVTISPRLLILIFIMLAIYLMGCTAQTTELHFGPSPGDPKVRVKIDSYQESIKGKKRYRHKTDINFGTEPTSINLGEEFYA